MLIFFYCCAAATPLPMSHDSWMRFVTVAQAILGTSCPPLLYDEDPYVMVSCFHQKFEPSTLRMDDIITQFLTGDVSSSVWGPAAWTMLHDLSQSPDHTKVPEVLTCWTHMLPCATCRAHLREHLNTISFTSVNSTATYKYTVALHNAVNVSLQKDVYYITDDEDNDEKT